MTRIPLDELRDALARAEREHRIVPDRLAPSSSTIGGLHSYQRITEKNATVARAVLDADGVIRAAARRVTLSPTAVSRHCWCVVVRHRRDWRWGKP